MIIDHTNRQYQRRWKTSGANKYNGAYYYSREIVKNIIPNVDTTRHWITVNIKGVGKEHSIVFVHNNLHPENYEWLRIFNDIVLVCGLEETVDKVSHIGKAIYLPLSIDTEYVKQFKLPKEQRHGIAFAGRPSKRTMDTAALPKVDILENMPRQAFLQKMATYEYVYAVGRTAIEAKALGCKLKAYDNRFPKVSRWKVLDNKEAAKILQERLNEIDG